ncbi:MAG: GDSL-type esterase/lipase family protein, partial [Polyangiales bacterium]
ASSSRLIVDPEPESEPASAVTPGAPEVAEKPLARDRLSRGPFSSKLSRALGCFALIAAIPYLHPRLAALRLIGGPAAKVESAPEATGIKPEYGELKLSEAQNEKPPILEESPGDAPLLVAAASASTKKPEIPVLSDVAKDVGAAYRPVEDPSGHALDGFFGSLAKTETGVPGAITRVAHYGDSLIVSDFMSSTLRRRFQARFGDAGHGFVLLAKPWAWYFHQDVTHWSSDGWKVHRIVNPRIADELYGYGGATFRTTDGGTRAGFGTAKAIPGLDPKNEKEAFGRRVSHFEVSYLEQPEGGGFDMLIDGKKVQSISTRIATGSPKKLAVAKVDVDDGEHQLEVKTTGSGEARFFGVVMERNVPGVVWDALGVNGGRARILDVNEDAHWAESLRSRNPALVILQYGTNESEDVGYPQEQYEATLEAVLRQVKSALPESSCLVVGPMDRAGAGVGGMETRPIIYKLNESQRKVAFKVGCAFWDTFLAMGGPGAMGRWVKATPKLGGGDLTHPTMSGATLLGDLLYAALNNAYLERR